MESVLDFFTVRTTLGAPHESATKAAFLDKVKAAAAADITSSSYYAQWGVVCLYIAYQYLTYVKRVDPDTFAGDDDAILKSTDDILRNVLSGQVTQEDNDLTAAFQTQSPLYVYIYLLFLSKGHSPAGASHVFDNVKGNIPFSNQPASAMPIRSGLKVSLNVCLMVATMAKEIKTRCNFAAGCNGDLMEFRRVMAIALTLVCQSADVFKLTKPAFEDVASKIVPRSSSTPPTLDWVEEIFADVVTSKFKDIVNTLPDFVQYFIHSIVNLRQSYKNFGNSCGAITSSDRRAIDKMVDESMEIGERVASDWKRGNDNVERDRKQKQILMATVVNLHYTIKVFMTLPWIAQVFSIDDLPRLLRRALDPRGGGSPTLDAEIRQHQINWRELFFVKISDSDEKLIKNTLNMFMDTISKDIEEDTRYVRNVIRIPEDADVRYMSRFHLHRHMAVMLFNSLNNMGIDQITTFAMEYVKSVTTNYDKMSSYMEGINAIRNLQSTALTTSSKSKSTVLSYVRIRANDNKFRLRHTFLLNTNMDTQFYIKYDSQYNLSPDQQTAKNNIVAKYALADSAHRQQLQERLDTSHAYAFGPFTRVFYPNHSNSDIANSSYEVLHGLLNGKSVMVMGFGISGAGKTSTLIYLKPAYGEPQRGVVLHWIVALQRQGYFKGGIKYRAVEYYGKGDVTRQWQLRKMTVEKSILDRDGNDDVDLTTMDTASSWRTIEVSDAMINTLGDELVQLVTNPAYRETKPTTNNDSSSRSHVVFTIEIAKEGSAPCYLHIVDLAGVENAFNTDSSTIVSGFMDPNRQSCRPPSVYLPMFKELNKARGAPSPPGTSDAVVNCTVFERYLFQDATDDTMPFLTDQGRDIQEETDKRSQGFTVAGLALRKWYMSSAMEDAQNNKQDTEKKSLVSLRVGPPTQTSAYASSQLWDSVIMNCYALYTCDDQGKVSVNVADGQKKNAVAWRLSQAGGGGALFRVDVKQVNPSFVMWAEPLKFMLTSGDQKGLDNFVEFKRTSAGLPGTLAGQLPKIIPRHPAAGSGTGSKFNFANLWSSASFAYDKLVLKGSLTPKDYTARFNNFVAIAGQALWIVPRGNVRPPPIMKLDDPPNVFQNVSMIDIAKLKHIAGTMMGSPTLDPHQTATDIIGALTLFKGELDKSSDAFMLSALSDPVKIKRVLHHLFGEPSEDMQQEPSSDITANFQQFLTFFASGSPAQQQRLYAYVQMVYAYVKDTLGLKRFADLTALTAPMNVDAHTRAYETECKLRAAIPLAMFILRKEESFDTYAAPSHPWTSPELKRVVDLPSAESLTSAYSARGVAIDEKTSNYDMGIDLLQKCMNLPVTPTGCPIHVNAEANRVETRPSDLSLASLAQIVRFLELAPDGQHAQWIRLFFMFAQLAAGIDDIAAKRNTETMRHVKHYMEQRTQEGKFINKSVYALRKSLFDIVEVQNAGNPYGNPMFLSECSFFGCHPVLDPQCFRQSKVKSDDQDRLMEYISKFQDTKDKLQICLMTAINVSSTVADPPAAPYINYTSLLHVYRLMAFRTTDDAVNRIVQQAIHPVDQKQPDAVSSTDIYNPTALDAATAPVLMELLTKALEDVSLEIQNAMPMAASLEDALKKIRDMLSMLKSSSSSGANGMPAIRTLKELIDMITFFNNSSLVGNLSFVDSLQKRSADGICDVSRRENNDALYSVDIPSLCGNKAVEDPNTKALQLFGEVRGPMYSAENIKRYIEG